MGKCSNCGGKRALYNLQIDPFDEKPGHNLYCKFCLLDRSQNMFSEDTEAWNEHDREAKEFIVSSDFEEEDSP